MPNPDGTHAAVRPRTAVLTAGFDPHLSFGSARPAVFRSSTYVFPSPEEAERAFSVLAGRVPPEEGARADLIYSRFSHPNAEILEDQIVPLEPGAQAAGVFNSGMAAIMTAFLAVARPGTTIVYTTPLYGGTTGLIHGLLEPFGVQGIPVRVRRHGSHRPRYRVGAKSERRVPRNARQSHPDDDRHPARRGGRRQSSGPARRDGGQHISGPRLPTPLAAGCRPRAVFRDQVPFRLQRHGGRRGPVEGPALMRKILLKRSMFGNILQPDECWMLDGRLPTVSLRMNRQSKNAQRLAEALKGHPKIGRVLYPTLFEDAEQRRIFEEQCAYPGGIFSLDFPGGRVAAFDFLRICRSDAMRFPSAAWKRWSAIRSPPPTPACPSRNWTRRASATASCAFRWASRTGAICWPILNRRSSG